MWRRKQEHRRAELLRAELSESLDHALRAAGYAAGGMRDSVGRGVRDSVGPRVAPAAKKVRSATAGGWESTRAALEPKGRRKRRRATGSSDGQRRRWPALALVAAGIAVGAAVAALRRRGSRWEEEQAAAAGAPEAGSPGAGSVEAADSPPDRGR